MDPGSSILVVDDDERFRRRLARALERRGYEVRVASRGDIALDLARTDPPELAVVDLRLPPTHGLDVVTELLAIDPQTRIVVLTAYGSIATAVRAVRLGAVHYLTKPANADAILAAFSAGAGGGVPGEVPTPSLERVEWEHIQRVLDDCGGNVSEAARRLRIHRRSLQRKLGRKPDGD